MELSISVAPLGEGQETSFSGLRLFHTICSSGIPMKIKRNQADTNQFSLQCNCGLELLVGSEAQTRLTYTAINGQPQRLTKEMYIAKDLEIESIALISIEGD